MNFRNRSEHAKQLIEEAWQHIREAESALVAARNFDDMSCVCIQKQQTLGDAEERWNGFLDRLRYVDRGIQWLTEEQEEERARANRR
jgi:hypothetical protein